MKKTLVALTVVLGFGLLALMPSKASAYAFEDMIDTWYIGGIGFDSQPILEGFVFSYTHDITDDVAPGDQITDAILELDFTNDLYDGWMRIDGRLFGYSKPMTEYVYYQLDNTGWNYLGEVDNDQYYPTLGLSLLDDGLLNVELFVSNHGNGLGTAYLDHSRLSGNAVPEPGTFALLGVGLGLLGFSMRKRFKK